MTSQGPRPWLKQTATKCVAVIIAALVMTSCSGGTAVEDPAGQQQGSAVQSIQLLSQTQGWALTEDGLKLTEDGGVTWSDITPPAITAAAIKSAFFLNDLVGWLVVSGTVDNRGAEQIAMYHTTDGGKTWADNPLLPEGLESRGAPAFLHFADENRGWVLIQLVSGSNFSVGRLFATDNGGSTWTSLAPPTAGEVRFASQLNGWIAGGPAGDMLYVTRDGGLSWEPQAVTPPAEFRSAYPVYGVPSVDATGQGGLAVTFAGPASGIAFYSTDDGGRTWVLKTAVVSPQTLPMGSRIASDMPGLNSWVAATPNGARFVAIIDGAKDSREIAPNGLPSGVVSLDFYTAEIGWALVHTGACPDGLKEGCAIIKHLLQTVDGGQTWAVLTP